MQWHNVIVMALPYNWQSSNADTSRIRDVLDVHFRLAGSAATFQYPVLAPDPV